MKHVCKKKSRHILKAGLNRRAGSRLPHCPSQMLFYKIFHERLCLSPNMLFFPDSPHDRDSTPISLVFY